MSTIFIAVQCCQCSTMQVKQRGKLNKWTCVVCNRKQSVRQVFAESPTAKHLRPYVQSSNMSRHFTPQPQHHHHNTLVSSGTPYNDSQKKKRTDWTQYLDPQDNDRTGTKQVDEQGDGSEPEIVTELPAELFKKPRVNTYGSGSGSTRIKPVFSKRNFNKQVVSPKDEQSKYELAITKDTPKSSQFMMRDDQEARTCQATKAATLAGSGNWNDYITQDGDDDDDLQLMNRRKRADSPGQWNNEMHKTMTYYDYETATNDESVEDDIHPDFL